MSSNKALQVKAPFDPEDPRCTRCYVPLQLTEIDFGWIDPPELNLCYECMAHVLEQAMVRLKRPIKLKPAPEVIEEAVEELPENPPFGRLDSREDYLMLFRLCDRIKKEDFYGSVDERCGRYNVTPLILNISSMLTEQFDDSRRRWLLQLFDVYVLPAERLEQILKAVSIHEDRDMQSELFILAVLHQWTENELAAVIKSRPRPFRYLDDFSEHAFDWFNRLQYQEPHVAIRIIMKQKDKLEIIGYGLRELVGVFDKQTAEPVTANKTKPKRKRAAKPKKKLTAKQKSKDAGVTTLKDHFR